MSSSEQIQRMLALVPLLQRNELSVSQLATQFQCTPAQIMKDLNTLWFVGPSRFNSSFIDINIDAVREDHDHGVRLGNAEYLRRPMRLTKSEASALLVALELIGANDDDANTAAIESTVEKIRKVSAGGDTQAQVLARNNEPKWVRVIQEALGADRGLSMDYYVSSRDETTSRRVDPVEVFHHRGHNYLDAWCHQVGARRLFRLDRVLALNISDHARSGQDLSLQDRADQPLIQGRGAPEAVVELDQEARWFVDYHPVLEKIELDGQRLRVRLSLVNPEWLLQEIASLGGRARILHPPELAKQLHQSVSRARALYDQ